MQKIVGSNEFVVEALSKYTQSEIHSPCSPLKLAPATQEQVYSPLTPLTPLTPLRIDSFDQASPLLPPGKRERFVKEDSLYLDLGKPEITGRIDTITSGSMSGSLLLANRADSSSNIGTTTTPSAFAKKSTARGNNKTYKSHTQGASNQSFLKAAIFRTMQKNNSEGFRDEDTFKSRIEELKAEKIPSENSPLEGLESEQVKERVSQSPDKGRKSLTQSPDRNKENTQNEQGSPGKGNDEENAHLNVDNQDKHQNRPTHSKMRRFHPFAPGNLIIPKNEVSSKF